MPLFKWTCCRRNVKDQVVSSSRKKEASPKKPKDGDYESDLQAVKWMRDRSKQKSYDNDDDDEQENGDTEEGDDENSPSRINSLPASRIPNENATALVDTEMTTNASSMDEGTPDCRVSIQTSSVEQQKTPPLSMNDDCDTDSDIDLSTKQRYDKAVKILHRAMLEKSNSLTSTERDFLHDLLDTDDYDSDERVEALTSAAQTLERDGAPPSPSRSLQQYSPPRRPEYRGVKLSIVKPNVNQQSLSENEEFELMIRSSSSMDADEDAMDIDDPPLLVIEDNLAMPDLLQESAPPRAVVSPSIVHDNDDDTGIDLPFYILGTSIETHPHVVSPEILEALSGFLPFSVSEENFLLKFSLVRDGASLATLLHVCRACKFTIIGVETMNGQVFGSFTGMPWRLEKDWYGTGEAFLWRAVMTPQQSSFDKNHHRMEVYPYTGMDDQVQYCSESQLAVGGGDWTGQERLFQNEPTGLGFTVDRHLAVGETNSCATFANPPLCANNSFEIANLEVWTTTPCISLEEANKLELHKLFVQEQRIGPY